MKRSPPSAAAPAASASDSGILAAPAAKKAKKEKPKLLRGDEREARMRAEAQNIVRNNSTLRKFTLAERAQFGHLYAKDIVEQLETMCDNIAESPALKGTFYERARAKVYEEYRGYAKKVLSFFRRYCDRKKLMQGLLESSNDFPWRTIKDPELEQDKDYLKWERQHFDDVVMDGKIRLQDFSDAVRSDSECVVNALVSAGTHLSDTWQHAKVEPTVDFAERVYEEFFTEAENEESLKYVEEFLVEKLGVRQDKVNEIKETLW